MYNVNYYPIFFFAVNDFFLSMHVTFDLTFSYLIFGAFLEDYIIIL